MKIKMSNNYHPRLQMIANYENFHPQIIACSHPILVPTITEVHQPPPPRSDPAQPRPSSRFSSTTTESITTTTTSLGAIAGSDGIVVFRWDEPHVPMLVLRHSNITTTTTSTTISVSSAHHPSAGGITSLAFSPTIQPTDSQSKKNPTTSPIYLAAVRGSSILIWDVTGHSIQPLQCRLGMTPSTTSSASNGASFASTISMITSMTWITLPDSASTNLYIAATTATMAGIWDLGSPFGINSNSNAIQRPCVRFADAAKYQEYSPYIQIACSNSATIHRLQCAIMSASGMVRIYNLHMTATTIAIDHPIHQLEACHSAGIGLTYIALQKHSTCSDGWVTWGIDASNTDPIVKIWMDTTSNVANRSNLHDGDSRSHEPEYRLMGQCTTPNLACARVCPLPITNTIVTISFNNQNTDINASQWRSDVWRFEFIDSSASKEVTDLALCDSNDHEDDDYGLTLEASLERIATFNGPSDEKNFESILVGKTLMPLRAAELTLLHSRRKYQSSKNELVLCCLTENGFLTTHVRILERNELKQSELSHTLSFRPYQK